MIFCRVQANGNADLPKIEMKKIPLQNHLLFQIDIPFPAAYDVFLALRPQKFAGPGKREM